jgi:hypothetical protein
MGATHRGCLAYYEHEPPAGQIQELSNEKTEIEKIKDEFTARHRQESGELLIKILRYRREKGKDTLQCRFTAQSR